MGALCVIQPVEIRSTPVAAIAGAVATVTRPEASVMARLFTRRTASAESVRAHVVEQDRIGTDLQHLIQLIEGIHLDLDLDEMADSCARPLQRWLEHLRQWRCGCP